MHLGVNIMPLDTSHFLYRLTFYDQEYQQCRRANVLDDSNISATELRV
jgi:hypothetical protein